MNDTAPTLLFPFTRGFIDLPAPGDRVLCFGACSAHQLPSGIQGEFTFFHDFRADYLALEQAGHRVVRSFRDEGVADESFDTALLLLGRHRRQNQLHFAKALRHVRPGGRIVAAGTKRDGVASMAKRIGSMLQLDGRLSKHHGIVFWLRRPEALDASVLAALEEPPIFTKEGYETATGGFSEGAVDPGSRLLADSLPPDIQGAVADFAAGWGYLSLRLAEEYPLTMLDLYEAHGPSLEAAERNFAAHSPEMRCRFFWHDLENEPIDHLYDVIVMNPPFHRGRAAEPELGQRLIFVAAAALKPGGRLFLVANRGLPYETTMQTAFLHHDEICRDESYKVLSGTK